MKDIFQKYSHIQFVDDKSKDDFIETLTLLYWLIENKAEQKEFLDILE